MNPENPPLVSGEALKAAAHTYLAKLQEKKQNAPQHLFSVFDNWFIRVMTRLSSFSPDKSWEESVEQNAALAWDFVRLRLFLDRWRQGRFVSYEQREKYGIHYTPKYGAEFGSDVLLTCQGAPQFMEWRGLPLMKTAFDFALYPQLIAELRPQSVFEIGSGSGASAIWLADQMKLCGAAGHVHSSDLVPVTAIYPGVTFYQGNCASPAALFDAQALASAPHPWLVVEDAHHNVEGVLEYFHAFLGQGDYLVVEDSEIKREDIRRFLGRHPGCYLVDTKYTDFFGRNATCAVDSIFTRTGI